MERRPRVDLDLDKYTYFERQYVTDLSSHRPVLGARHGLERGPTMLQELTNWSSLPPLQNYRRLPSDHQHTRKMPQKMEKEKRRGREPIYKEREREQRRATALVGKEMLRKSGRDHERKRRKELDEEAATPRSPVQSSKHRRKERSIEQAPDADVGYEDWEPHYQVALSHPAGASPAPCEALTGQNSRRREGPRHKHPKDTVAGCQWRKLEPYVLPRAGYRKVYPEGSQEEPEHLPGYERHRVRMLHGLGPSIESRENKPKQKRNLIRPPPYIPPPAYNAQHRTFKADGSRDILGQQPPRVTKLRAVNLEEKVPEFTQARARSQQGNSDGHMGRDVKQNAAPPKLELSQNSATDALQANGFAGAKRGEKEPGTEKRKRFDLKIYKTLLGWKLPQGFGTWGGSVKHQEGEVKLQREQVPCPSQVENVEDVYETVEWDRVPPKSQSIHDRKARSASPSKHSTVGLESADGMAAFMVSNQDVEDVATAKCYTLPRAANEQRRQSQHMHMGTSPEDKPCMQKGGDEQRPTMNREWENRPEQKRVLLRGDKRQTHPPWDYEAIPPYSRVWPTHQEGHGDKLPYEWGFSYATSQPPYVRKRMAFQELYSNGELTECRSPLKSNYGKDPRIHEEAGYRYTDGRYPSYSQTLPREKPSRGRPEAREDSSEGRRRSLERVPPVFHEKPMLENSGERMASMYDPSFPKRTEPGNASTLPRSAGTSRNQFEKHYQQFGTSYETPRENMASMYDPRFPERTEPGNANTLPRPAGTSRNQFEKHYRQFGTSYETPGENMASMYDPRFPKWTEPGNAKTLPRPAGTSRNQFEKHYRQFGTSYETPGESMASMYDPRFPKWTEPGNAKTLPRKAGKSRNQFGKDYQQFRTSYETPGTRYPQHENKPSREQPPAWTEASEGLSEKRHKTSQKDSDGMFVIDATCVLVRAEYIFPPKMEQVKYLHPTWVGAGHGGLRASDEKRDLGREYLSEQDLQGQCIGDHKLSPRSPCQKRILNNRPSDHPTEATLEMDSGRSSKCLGSPGMERTDTCSASTPYMISNITVQERAAKILGLSVADLDPLLETRQGKATDSQTNEGVLSNRSTGDSSSVESPQARGEVTSCQDDRFRTLTRPAMCEGLFLGPTGQEEQLNSSRGLGSRKVTLLDECSLGEFSLPPESDKTNEESSSDDARSARSSLDRGAVGNARLLGKDGPDQMSVMETIAEGKLPLHTISEACEEPLLAAKEKNDTAPCVVPLVPSEVASGLFEDRCDWTQVQENDYPKVELPCDAMTRKLNEEANLGTEEQTLAKALYPSVQDGILVERGFGQVLLQEAVCLQNQFSKETRTEDEKEQHLDKCHDVQRNTKEPLVADDWILETREEVARRFPGEDQHDLGFLLQNIMPETALSKDDVNGAAVNLPGLSTDDYPKGTALVKPSTRRRGFYAKDLHEAVSRIRRHTAPDSDTDEEQGCESPVCARKPNQKVNLLQRDWQEKDNMAYSSSDSYDSEATVIMCDSDEKKEQMLGWEGPSPGSSTDAEGKWLVSDGRVQEETLNPSDAKNPYSESDLSTPKLDPKPREQPGCAVAMEAGDPGPEIKTGSDLRVCIEEILKELNQTEIDFFGTGSEDAGDGTMETKAAEEKTLRDS